MDKISELLDDYGWAEGDDLRKTTLLKWMTEATNRIQELQHKVDNIENLERGLFEDLEAKLIEKGVL